MAADDKATRATYGLLNLTHRASHETPEPLEPGHRYRVRVQLNDVAQSFAGDDFTSPRGETLCIRGFRRGEWAVRAVTRTVLTCDAENFYIRAELDAREGDVRIFSGNWDRTIPRNLV